MDNGSRLKLAIAETAKAPYLHAMHVERHIPRIMHAVGTNGLLCRIRAATIFSHDR